MKVFILIIILFISTLVFSYETDNIRVDRCDMSVIIAQSQEEKTNGLLGYDEKSFKYDGMLFEMNTNKVKYFHTEGMLMPIYIVAVIKLPNGNYITEGDIYYAPAGIPSISLYGVDVLELPVSKYKFSFRSCLNARLGSLN